MSLMSLTLGRGFQHVRRKVEPVANADVRRSNNHLHPSVFYFEAHAFCLNSAVNLSSAHAANRSRESSVCRCQRSIAGDGGSSYPSLKHAWASWAVMGALYVSSWSGTALAALGIILTNLANSPKLSHKPESSVVLIFGSCRH